MEVVDRLGGDVVQAHQMRPAFGVSIAEGWKPASLLDGSPVMVPEGLNPESDAEGNEYIRLNDVLWAKKPRGGLYFDQIAHPYGHCENEDDIDRVPIVTWSEQELDFLESEVKALHATTEKAILLPFGGNIFEAGQLDFGYATFFMNLIAEPDLMHYYFNRITDVYMKNLEALLPRVGHCIQVIQFGDDLGTQQAGQISVQTYKDMIKPYHARQYQYVRNHFPAVKVFLHSCGAIMDYLPNLIDAGIEVLNPVQLSAAGMDPTMLKRTYGKALSFWGGGSNTPVTATGGTPDDIRRESRALIEIFAPGGGYVFNQVHNVQPNVSPENILAIYDTALEYRAERRGSR
jgi:uroporphyrinogen decarboxylase